MSDVHEGLRRAIEGGFPGVTWQRCIVHLMRIVIILLLHAVFGECDPDLACELYHLACEEAASIYSKAVGLLEEAETDDLAHLDFPYTQQDASTPSNVQKRVNCELKRRSRVVQVFPSRKSLIRMLSAVFSEIDEDWAERRWFTEESTTQAMGSTKTRVSTPDYVAPPKNMQDESSMS